MFWFKIKQYYLKQNKQENDKIAFKETVKQSETWQDNAEFNNWNRARKRLQLKKM